MRRRIFAAPLVIVLACGPRGPGARGPERDDEAEAEAGTAETAAATPAPATPASAAPAPSTTAPSDATTAPPTAIPDEPPPPRPPTDREQLERAIDECADPGRAYREHGTLCNPPSQIVVVGAVIDVKVVAGDRTMLTFALGTRDGIRDGDQAVLLDGDRQPVRGGAFVVERVTAVAGTGTVALTPAQITGNHRVRVTHRN